MDKIINPLDGEMDLLGDTKSDIVRKLNPLNGRLEVVYKADSYIQKINPFIGDFDMVGGTGASYIIKEVTGNGYINLTNAVANHLMELKAYGGTEQRNDISYAQGPSPDGFHVPSKNERVALIDTMTDLGIDTSSGNCMKTYMKMPFAGRRNNSSSDVSSQGTDAHYWTTTATSANVAYYLEFSSSWVSPLETYYRSYGFSVRCFKDTPVAPNSSWTTLYSGTGNAGIFHNSTLGLISVSGDGTTWTTIADKNLGATVVYNDGDALAESNCGYYYQWGNNYGFAFTGTVTTSNTQVDASSYGPGNYYSSSTFITSYDWSSVRNDNLWGGVSVAATDPTPTIPIDIVCNNGVLKARHQSGLPTGYTQYEYLRSSGTQYIDLGYKGNGNTKVEVKFKYHTTTSATGSGRVFGSRITSSNNAFAIGTSSGVVYTSNNKVFRCYDGQPYYVDEEDAFGLDVWQTVVFSATEHTVNGVTVGDDYEITEFETPNNLLLFAFDNNGTVGVGYVDIAYCKLWNNGVLVRDLIPCKNGSNVIGMYDRVSETLLTNTGTGTFTAGNTVSDPIEIYTDGTTETIGVSYLNTNITFTDGLYIGGTGKISTGYGNWKATDYIAVVPGTYKLTFTNNHSDYYKRVAFYTSDTATYGEILSAFDGRGVTGDQTVEFTVTQSGYVCMCIGKTDVFKSLEIPVGEATAEMLLKVGDNADEQEILSGSITRKVGIKVLDGTETYSKRSDYAISYTGLADRAYGSNIYGMCSHFVCSANNASTAPVGRLFFNTANNYLHFFTEYGGDVASFKAWLAQQYAAGTPVIVVYPLATPTTETVTGQTMNIQDGSNTIEITQASIDNLGLYAKYKATA